LPDGKLEGQSYPHHWLSSWGSILPHVGLKFAADLLAHVRILVNVEDVQGSDLLDNMPQE
jgi:hypothetical protein